MRINLQENFNMAEVYKWFNDHVGQQEEHVTWFWSHDVQEYKDIYGNTCHQVREGVEVWNQDPLMLTLLLLKMGDMRWKR